MYVSRFLGSAAVVSTLAFSATAETYLTGALIYWSDAVGNNVAGAYEFDTFSTTPNSKMSLNGDASDPVVSLLPGLNFIDFASPHGTTLSLGLFLSDVAVANSGPFGLAPDLVIAGTPGAVAPTIPAAGVLVSTFGQFSPSVPFHGLDYVDIGADRVSVVGFTYSPSGGNGTVTLRVGPIPAPGSLALVGVAGLLARRRRSRAS